ncbi:MAG: PorT family protein [Prevotella sp.]|jgi:hypothetical protein|nr:PorT family protein [Prevotella sp.]
MKQIYRIILAFSAFSILSLNLFSQAIDDKKTLDISLALGFNIGATAPMPIPAQVRKVNSYNPKANPQIGLYGVYSINDVWGIGTGILLDWKGMRVTDEVKYMHTSVILADGGERLTGYFVGKNMTNVSMSYLTVPIYGTYRFNDRWQVKLGIYAAKALSSKFDGNVSDGYIRIDTPTGQKQEITENGASFDFSGDIRDSDFGLLAGGEFRLTNTIGFYGNLSWGLVPFFYSGSNPIEFTMRNIYGTIGITYRYNK